VQITFWQYRVQRPLKDMPAQIAEPQRTFEKDVACIMRAMANEVAGKPVPAIPDIQASAARVREEIRKYYQGLDRPISVEGADMIGLTESLASIIAPLYEDIHATFAEQSEAAASQAQRLPTEALS